VEKVVEILLVEDDPVAALRLSRELNDPQLRFRTRRVKGRAEFIHALRQLPPDLILSEQTLAGFSGFAALDLARELSPTVPFIFVSGNCDQGRLVEMFESGASGHVFKQRLGDLLPLIRQLLDGGRAQKKSAKPSIRIPPAPGRSFQPAPGTLPICSGCRKIRNPTGVWEQIETYLSRHPRVTVGLAVCPACASARFSKER
jgi:CheY-like chemotaxis protein